MKFKLKIKRTIQIEPEILRDKIDNYLIKNSYRILERGVDYVFFADDEFSDRKRYRSDFHTRIGEGKFVLNYSVKNETNVELIYFTSILSYVVVVLMFSAFGIYVNNFFIPFATSFILATPILWRIFYLNEHVFDEIMQC